MRQHQQQSSMVMLCAVTAAALLLLQPGSTPTANAFQVNFPPIPTAGRPASPADSKFANKATLVTDDISIGTTTALPQSTPRRSRRRQLLTRLQGPAVAQPQQGLPDPQFMRQGTSMLHQAGQAITRDLYNAVMTRSHPMEQQQDLGAGKYLECDWRDAWKSYAAPADNPSLVDQATGHASYDCEVEGNLPDDLEGVLYRNGPGKFGVGGERIQHVLDADGLVLKMEFPKKQGPFSRRKVKFTSRFVETKGLVEERKADKFLFRGTFGTGPTAFFDKNPKKGINAEPTKRSWISKMFANAFNMDLKNPANTQVISHGGKLLALFEAGLPHALDPKTLKTKGEDTLAGTMKKGFPIKFGIKFLDELLKDVVGGAAHTAHPNTCPKTGNLVGWHYTQVLSDDTLELTFNEWGSDKFDLIDSNTFRIPGTTIPPHDMAMSDNYVMLKFNALKNDQQQELLFGIKSPGESITMDGQAPATAWFFPRPTSKNQFEPFSVEVPPCFSVHFSHSYEDPDTGNFVTYFAGWPPSDRTDLLGAWSGYCPKFRDIPPTFLWRLEVDVNTRKTVSLNVAPGSANACLEFPSVHPSVGTSKAENVYAIISNVIGDSTAPNGYCRLEIEKGSKDALPIGTKNEDIDAYWFGSRHFTGEPLIIPKKGGDRNDEKDAYLIGMVKDSAKDRSFLAVFDLQRELKQGPICKVWTKGSIPHGLHGCFAENDSGASSVFC